MSFDKEIDTCGLNCPLPILKAKKALTDMTSGQVLQVALLCCCNTLSPLPPPLRFGPGPLNLLQLCVPAG